jgi:competence protein ComEC
MKLFILFCFFAWINSSVAAEVIVWNVGQGQWVTAVTKDRCLHFDIGGEINVTKDVLKLCRGKLQVLALSHWDFDHISFALKYSLAAGQTCLWKLPIGKASAWKQKMLSEIPPCENKHSFSIENNLVFQPMFSLNAKSNDLSSVFLVHGILIPGDSSVRMEKIWAHRAPKAVYGLVLGHHGSQTSTSEMLLKNLPKLRWAVASAREKKYGHPHKKVLHRLKQWKIPVLKTEDWGHLHFLGL